MNHAVEYMDMRIGLEGREIVAPYDFFDARCYCCSGR
jgi:hypothetical protein